MYRWVHVRCAYLEGNPSAATVQQPHQDRTEHSRSSTPFDHPNSAYLSYARGRTRTHPESLQRLCTAEVRGSNPLGSTLEAFPLSSAAYNYPPPQHIVPSHAAREPLGSDPRTPEMVIYAGCWIWTSENFPSTRHLGE